MKKKLFSLFTLDLVGVLVFAPSFSTASSVATPTATCPKYAYSFLHEN